jgi:Flp pilus assembly CpaE family ATPase
MAAITSSNVANAIVKLVAADALPALMGNLVLGNLVNRDYEPALAQAGDTINVPIPALRNARRVMSFMAGRERNAHLEVILNRFNAKETEIDENSATKALGRPVDWKIPNDYQSVRTAENTGVPLAMKPSPISRVMDRMAVNAAGRPAQTVKKPKTLRGLFR